MAGLEASFDYTASVWMPKVNLLEIILVKQSLVLLEEAEVTL